MGFVLKSIPLSQIDLSPVNPRTDAEHSDLEGLTATIQTEGIVQPPSVIQTRNGRYEVLLGERRIRAARMAGLEQVDCLVTERLDPLDAHRARLVENLHRAPLNPLDEALALRVSWLLANAEALGLHKQAQALMAQQQPLGETLPQLEGLLNENGFKPTAPPVTWDTVLNGLGVELKPENRKKLLRALSVAPEVHDIVRPLGLTSAALRSLGTLAPEQQACLVQEVAQNPGLARKIRRIARVVRDSGYTLEEAIAEAKGQTDAQESDEGFVENSQEESQASEQILQLLEAATRARQAVDTLTELLGEDFLAGLSSSWRGYAQEAIAILKDLQSKLP
jgi:ParB-like chromosome segregation protein Spo0J